MNKRAITSIGLEELKLVLKLPEHVHVEFAFQDEVDRLRQTITLVLSGADLPDEFLFQEGNIPKWATMVVVETGKQIPEWETQLEHREEEELTEKTE